MLGLYHIDKTQTGSESNPSYSLYEISGIGFRSEAVRVKIIKIVLFKVRNEAQAVYYSDVVQRMGFSVPYMPVSVS